MDHDGASEPLRLDRPVSLLVYLAVRGSWVTRSELAYLYRPDEPEADALRYLRKIIFRARQLPWAVDLRLSSTALSWRVESDVGEFRQALANGLLREALSAYGGEFLGGATLPGAAGFTEWQEVERRDLESQWIGAAVTVAREHERAGQHAEAASLLETVQRHDPLDEEVLQSYLRALAQSGGRTRALSAFDRFRAMLQSELSSQPLESTQALVDSIRNGEATSPAAGTVPVVRAEQATLQLPTPVTRFIGRSRELEEVTALLADPASRLVTLVGLGGSGKTRLALEAARLQRQAFGDGVAYVSLAEVQSADLFPATVTNRLGLPWSSSDPEEALIAGLRDRNLLLVLDDFERVAEVASMLPRLLEEAPRLKLLIASREALEVPAEWLVDVSGLKVPPPDAEVGLDEYDAVKLFMQRAARVDSGFTPSQANLLAIADICRSVEGLPLAIELAASWTRALGCEALRRELDRNSSLLTTTLRNVPERHRSLWSVFDYTIARLPPAARDTLPLLTVFRGGFTLDAAQEVAGAHLDVLLSLMNRTLIRRGSDGRYSMHALVRQYARLQQPPHSVSAAHAAYYAQMLQRLTADLKGRDPVTALIRVQADLANVEVAWDYAASNGDAHLLDLAREALDHYYHYRSQWSTAREAFDKAATALDETKDAGEQRVLARLLLHLAQYERALGDVERAVDRVERATQLLQPVGGPLDLGHALLERASNSAAAGDYRTAEQCLRRVLATAKEQGDGYLEGAAHNGIANALSATRADLDEAETHYRASLSAHQRLGNLEGINGALINLGACRYDLGDLADAASLWGRALDIARRLGYRQREAVLHNNLGSLAEARGELELAAGHYAHSLELRQEIGDRPGVANVLHNLGRLALMSDDLDSARATLGEALEICDALGNREMGAHVRSTLARALVSKGRLRDAERYSNEALELASESGSRAELLAALLTRAELYEQLGDIDATLRVASYVRAEAGESEGEFRKRAAELIERIGRSGDGNGSVPAPASSTTGAYLLEFVARERSRAASPQPDQGRQATVAER